MRYSARFIMIGSNPKVENHTLKNSLELCETFIKSFGNGINMHTCIMQTC